jgi:predicted ester cyclase
MAKTKTDSDTTAKSVEEHVTSLFEAIGRRDVEALGEHWREDGVDEIVPIGVLRGRSEIKDFFRGLFAAVPDLETSVVRVVPGDRLAAVEWRMTGTFTGEPFQGIDPTGKAVELRGLDLVEVEENEVVGITAYYDGAEFARQVGLMPPQDSSAERALKAAFNAVTKVRKAVAERTSG